MSALQAVLGLGVVYGGVYLVGRRQGTTRIGWVAVGILLQVVLAFLLIRFPWAQKLLLSLDEIVLVLERITQKSTQYLFGYLAGGASPFEITNENANFIIAYRVLPLILVISALSALLFHWGVIPFLIRIFAKLLSGTLGISGPLGFGASATLFFGTIESPILIKPYLHLLGRGQMLALLTCTMSTISGAVMVLYSSVLSQIIPNAIGHMITASVISIPAALVLSHLLIPYQSSGGKTVSFKKEGSAVEALVKSTAEGVEMVIQITGMILVLFALIYLVNEGLSLLPLWHNEPVTLERLLGTLLRPIMWLTGIGWDETLTAGKLMASKMVLNEFVAYLEMGKVAESLTPSTRLRLTYALCGFANLASLGIILGGLGAVLPQRRSELAELGWRALVLGNLATLTTAMIAGVITDL